MTEYLRPIKAVGNIPHYMALMNYEWVEDFLKSEKLAMQIVQLKKRIAELEKLPPTKKELIQLLEDSFNAYRQRRVATLSKMLSGQVSGNKTIRTDLSFLDKESFSKLLSPLVLWEEIQEAVNLLPIPMDLPPAAEREVMISEIKKEIGALTEKLSKCCPPGYYLLRDGQITGDARREFVFFWEDMQRKLNAPCGPRGQVIGLSSDVEQKAYYRLGIDKCVNRKTDIAPNPGTRYTDGEGGVYYA